LAACPEKQVGHPLNEVRMPCSSMPSKRGCPVFRQDDPLRSGEVDPRYRVGDRIELTQADFVRLGETFLGEIEKRYG
jgi:hypothetical protein